ncbi:hypothetical protein Kpol_1071p8 [Vanderwaltozyma polyspora DSM 70294]|uniref:Ribonuclease P/MRP protein subunit POP5 n=1 Tax=Vanderwaltozyma polyspora (strain ATCC 22028 / DSM 70294 / BCRC 21397 / CBS 2163 / NBRC 10782 / NRRL Y-8283 / UCD 57-17) TaxID=436907 RepID=A7TRK3_VANPO|nr:uncharacterized protein Kpol_1071p8 [Vanderwaltozyma polyspora DSM 70294]EDO15101.1 hypothetical protein Kpol_1071p8 [Vanderwaltozyma polyspora DSM 70294]
MVRLKSRYILFEILYPNSDENGKMIESKSSLRKDILLRQHRVSPPEISIKTIIQEIRRSLQLNFGDYGSGKVSSLLQSKYFSNMTSTGIIRCHREDCDTLIMALFFINKIGDIDNLIINPVKVSGTIKKIEEYSIRRNKKLANIMDRDQKSFIDDYHSVSDDEPRED